MRERAAEGAIRPGDWRSAGLRTSLRSLGLAQTKGGIAADLRFFLLALRHVPYRSADCAPPMLNTLNLTLMWGIMLCVRALCMIKCPPCIHDSPPSPTTRSSSSGLARPARPPGSGVTWAMPCGSTSSSRTTTLPLLASARSFRERVEAQPPGSWVVVDEVQRLPGLLNEVHDLISRHGDSYKFALSGSSARKLRRLDVNLLAGRVIERAMFPLVARGAGLRLQPRCRPSLRIASRHLLRRALPGREAESLRPHLSATGDPAGSTRQGPRLLPPLPQDRGPHARPGRQPGRDFPRRRRCTDDGPALLRDARGHARRVSAARLAGRRPR